MQTTNYHTFKVLGILLWYPDTKWLENLSDLYDIVEKEELLAEEDRDALRGLTDYLAVQDIFDLQEAYVDTFDRVRSLSLHLFEHVHGESRDRGQAMVDLAEMYKEQGLEIDQNELPDYLPVFLEFLSHLPKDEALEMLGDPGHVMAALGKRLAERGSPYHVVFDALVRLTGREPENVERKAAPAASLEQLDKEWEEKPIEFMGASAPEASSSGCGGGGCGSGSGGCGG